MSFKCVIYVFVYTWIISLYCPLPTLKWMLWSGNYPIDACVCCSSFIHSCQTCSNYLPAYIGEFYQCFFTVQYRYKSAIFVLCCYYKLFLPFLATGFHQSNYVHFNSLMLWFIIQHGNQTQPSLIVLINMYVPTMWQCLLFPRISSQFAICP